MDLKKLPYAIYPPSITRTSTRYHVPVFHPVLPGPQHITICQLSTQYYPDRTMLTYDNYPPCNTRSSPH